VTHGGLIVVLPLLIPLLTAVLCLLAWRAVRRQRWLGAVGGGAHLAASLGLFVAVLSDPDGILTLQVGDWPAPFGITLVADVLAAILVVLTALVGFAVLVYSVAPAGMDDRREAFGYYPLVHVLLLGVCGAFLTGDLFNLYVWFEVLLIASFVLLTLGGQRPQLVGGLTYVALNLVSSAIFLAAVGLVYGHTGTLNMAELARRLPEVRPAGLVTTVATLFLVAFGIKAACFPLFFWLPAAYHTPPPAVSALFAGLLSKVGVYALLRAFTLLFVQDVAYTHALLLVVAGLTMLAGSLGALPQRGLRRALSFLLVGHIGFPLMGLALFTHLGLAGAIFYLVEDIVVITALFLVSGLVRRLGGTETLTRLGGLYAARPAVAALFLLPAFSLAGVPPLSGFFAKLGLLRAGLEVGQYAIVATALGASVLTLLAVSRIWSAVFWKSVPTGTSALPDLSRPDEEPAGDVARGMVLPVAGLVGLVVVLGVAAEPVVALATRAAAQLLDRSAYMRAVLGGG
jgi:multicomponent Na+:H+ antiporter subunit D